MKGIKVCLALLLAIAFVLSAVGCAAPAATEATGAAPAAEAPAAEAPAAEEPAADAPAEEASAPKPVLLAVSFGTSYNDSRDVTIGAVEKALADAFPDYEVRRAFTSQIIIDVLKERDGLAIDNVKEAMDRLVADGVKEVVIQPTHIMSGFEYDDVIAEVMPYADKFESFKVGKTLLTTDEDYTKLVAVLAEETKDYNVEGTAIAFMGHGTEHEANTTYGRLQKRLTSAGYTNYYVGTVEGSPLVDEVIAAVQETDAKKAVLLPLMIVAGDHANNDMAGDEEDSWKSAFTAAGYEVECVIKGLGQYKGVQEMIVEHCRETIEAKPVLLTVSFGTSYNDSRDVTIGAVEKALADAFPDYEVRRAFTSQIIIDVLKERDGLVIDNVTEAMDRLVADGVRTVMIQPTHIMSGFEYDDVIAEVMPYADRFDSFKVGKTLLTTDEDYAKLVAAITEETKEYNAEGTAIAFMGHGTEHEANATYTTLQKALTDAGYANYFVGTVEGSPLVDEVITAVKGTDAKKVVLLPLMIVAGDHANNDMAGDEEDSWKTAFVNAGFEVECVLKGLGQYAGVQEMIVAHCDETIAE